MDGIFYDISQSYYFIEIDKMRFYFSSEFNKNRFNERYETFVKNETSKMEVRFQNKIDIRNLVLIKLYKVIEKRGFRVYYENELLKDYSFKLVISME